MGLFSINENEEIIIECKRCKRKANKILLLQEKIKRLEKEIKCLRKERQADAEQAK